MADILVNGDDETHRSLPQQSRQLIQNKTETALRASGQRRINIIWELTQAFVAMAVTIATLYVSSNLALNDKGQTAAFLLLSNAFFLVIGFYFGRTNHSRPTAALGATDGEER